MVDNEALFKIITRVLLVITTSLIGAMVGAFLGAIRGPFYVLSKLGEGGQEDAPSQPTNNGKDRI